MKLNEASRRYYGVKCSGGSRPRSDIHLIVGHQTVSAFNAASNVAAYLKGRSDGSVQYVVDDNNTFVLMPDRQIACGVAGYNEHTVHIEHCGPSPGKPAAWLRHVKTLQRGAWIVARELRERHLPCKYRTTADLNAGRTHGYTEHKELSLSNLSSSTHTDEFPGAAGRKWRALVKANYIAFKVHVPKIRYIG